MPLKCYCTKAEKYDAVQTENNPYPTVIFSFPAEACNCVYVTQNVYFIIRIFMIFFFEMLYIRGSLNKTLSPVSQSIYRHIFSSRFTTQ